MIGSIHFAQSYNFEITPFHYKLFFMFLCSFTVFIGLPILAIKASKNVSYKKTYRYMSLLFLLLSSGAIIFHLNLFSPFERGLIQKDRETLRRALSFQSTLKDYHDFFDEFPNKLKQAQAALTRRGLWNLKDFDYQKLSKDSYRIKVYFFSPKNLPVKVSSILKEKRSKGFTVYSRPKVREYSFWIGNFPFGAEFGHIIVEGFVKS